MHRYACGIAKEIQERFSLSLLGQLQSDRAVIEKEACVEIIFQVYEKCCRAFFDFEKVFTFLKFLILLAPTSPSSFFQCYARCRGLENLAGKTSCGTQSYACSLIGCCPIYRFRCFPLLQVDAISIDI